MKESENFIAHIKKGYRGEVLFETVDRHCEDVADMAKYFARHTHMGDLAYLAGRMHDVGKKSPYFQAYIKQQNGLPYDEDFLDMELKNHSIYGALALKAIDPKLFGMLGPLIAGHHTGIPDYVDFIGVNQDKTVPDYIQIPDTTVPMLNTVGVGAKEIWPYTLVPYYHRMLFIYSCMVDADSLVTERFIFPKQSDIRNRPKDSVSVLFDKCTQYIDRKYCNSSNFLSPSEIEMNPTQKPVELIEYLVMTYTNEGDVILDNCMGSGTTAIAALNTGRKFFGFEKDERYFEIACERIRKHTVPTDTRIQQEETNEGN